VQRAKAYLSLCAAYRDDAAYLREWIEFHLLVGVERLLLYNNDSRDEHREVLAPYVESGTAVVHDWSLPVIGGTGRPSGIMRAFDHCVEQHGDDSRWIAFLDVDEFLFSPTGRPVSEVLADYEGSPGVCVHRAEFGTSGHRTRPSGAVIENYVHRLRQRPDSRGYFKSVVDPPQVARCASVHHFAYRDGFAVDENQIPVVTGIRPEKTFVSYSRLRINHYATKSEEELRRKWELWEEGGTERPELPSVRLEVSPIYELDETIQAYLPALRRALEGNN
jgi:hypothetical protein